MKTATWSWVHQCSKGSLKKPSETFINEVKLLETVLPHMIGVVHLSAHCPLPGNVKYIFFSSAERFFEQKTCIKKLNQLWKISLRNSIRKKTVNCPFLWKSPFVLFASPLSWKFVISWSKICHMSLYTCHITRHQFLQLILKS